MSIFSSFLGIRSALGIRRIVALVCIFSVGFLLTGCLSLKQYVDPTLPKVDYGDLKPSDTKQPVQVFFEYQTNATTNAKATEGVRPIVLAAMKKSNLFSDVVVAPATADRKLYITINNFPVTKDASSKGFVTGLTFGMAGTMVTDGFMMNTEYVAPGKDAVKHSYQHALHSTIGNADGPVGLVAAPKGEAMHLIVDGLVLNLLNDMSHSGELQ